MIKPRRTIDAPGLYEMTADQYHADPAPTASLSNSVAQILLARSPWHAWHAHPLLNPAFQVDDGSKRLDLGSVAHALLLGNGRDLEIIEAENFRTKAAQEARDKARMAGRIPVLTADLARAQAMAGAARAEIDSVPALASMFHSPEARSEVVALWREGDCWARCMIDRTDLRTVLDYKTTTNASPAAASRHLYQQGYHLQRAMYLRGLDAVDPERAGRRKFYFLFQEIDEPFACSVLECDGTGATMGERQCGAAVRMWQQCMATDLWPSYPALVHRAAMPPWMEAGILAREIEDDERERVPSDILKAG